MSSTIALGSGPIAFTTKDGQALLIPLTAINFENGAVKLSATYSNYQAELQPWLNYLAKQKTITAGEIAPPQPALIIKATAPGIAGNNIQIEFKNVTPDQFDAIVTEKETYTLSLKKNSPIFIEKILSGSNLVDIKDTDPQSQPKPGSYQLVKEGAQTKATTSVLDGGNPSGIAFKLEAKKVGDDGNNTVARIPSIDAAAQTFVMDLTWTKIIEAITLGDLPAKLEGTNKITVTKPDSLTGFTIIPSAGLFTLNGGADKRDAMQASATIPAS